MSHCTDDFICACNIKKINQWTDIETKTNLWNCKVGVNLRKKWRKRAGDEKGMRMGHCLGRWAHPGGAQAT